LPDGLRAGRVRYLLNSAREIQMLSMTLSRCFITAERGVINE
jgi:hypothetical protein